MDFTVPEEIGMLRENLRRFVTEEVLPLQREHDLSFDTAPPKDLRRHVRRRSKALGLYGLDMPTEVGGAGLSFSASRLPAVSTKSPPTKRARSKRSASCERWGYRRSRPWTIG